MAEEDVEVVRKGYAAFATGDLRTLNELFAEDATWVVPGSTAPSPEPRREGTPSLPTWCRS